MNDYIKFLLCFLTVLMLMGNFVGPVNAQNPFGEQRKEDKPASPHRTSHALLDRLTLWQNQVRGKISALIAESKQSRSLRPITGLVLLALAYGILHAAGPGHGKAVAASYILSHRPHYLKGLVFGNLIALFHGGGGIIFVMIVYGVLHISVFKNMMRVSDITQIVSYTLIICLGVFMLTSVVWEWRKKSQPSFADQPEESMSRNTAAALIIGIIPCPAVIMVMLLALSMDLVALGILLGICICLGMAITISAVVIACMAGKRILIEPLESKAGRTQTVEQAIRGISGLLVTTLGILLLVSVVVP
jgi:nickel/cobalt exporter